MAPIVSSTGGANPGQGVDDTVFGLPRWAVLAATGGILVAGVAYYVLKDPAPKKKGRVVKLQILEIATLKLA